MVTRSSHNWVGRAGAWDTLKTRFIDFDEFPTIGAPFVLDSSIVPLKANSLHQIAPNSLIDMFVDDYRLEKFWNRLEYYVEKMRGAAYVMTPDFSMLYGMPTEMLQWQVYRNRLIGYVYEKNGLKVIPTVSWADQNSYSMSVKGIKKGSTIAVSNVGARHGHQISKFLDGMNYVKDVIEPAQILICSNKKYKNLFEDKIYYHIDSFWDVKRKKLKEYGR